jgi:hypothetical protein
VAGNLSPANTSQTVVIGTSEPDTLTGVGGSGSDLLVGSSGTDTAQYAVVSNAISLTGQITPAQIASAIVNIKTANIDVLTGIEQIDFTSTGYTTTTTTPPSNNQLRSSIQSFLANNSIAAFAGDYDSVSGNFTFGVATPNATLIAFDSNPLSGTNYEAFLLLDKTAMLGSSISLDGGTVNLTGL